MFELINKVFGILIFIVGILVFVVWCLEPESVALVTPPQSVVFDASKCNDIIELPSTETIWGDVSNGYRCGHE